jgi:glutathione S-transferase
MTPKLRLISHKLCPYVQRAVIVATEKHIPFDRIDINLAKKPAWFRAISPTGKTPLLEVTTGPGASAAIIFESAVIAEFLDEISGAPLLPRESLERARHRSWIEFASTTLNSIGKFYAASDRTTFEEARKELLSRISQIEPEILGPWFSGPGFGLVDAAFGPAFRYLEVFRALGGLDFLSGSPEAAAWSKRLLERPSVREAVSPDYPELLVDFIRKKDSYLSGLLHDRPLAA